MRLSPDAHRGTRSACARSRRAAQDPARSPPPSRWRRLRRGLAWPLLSCFSASVPNCECPRISQWSVYLDQNAGVRGVSKWRYGGATADCDGTCVGGYSGVVDAGGRYCPGRVSSCRDECEGGRVTCQMLRRAAVSSPSRHCTRSWMVQGQRPLLRGGVRGHGIFRIPGTGLRRGAAEMFLFTIDEICHSADGVYVSCAYDPERSMLPALAEALFGHAAVCDAQPGHRRRWLLVRASESRRTSSRRSLTSVWLRTHGKTSWSRSGRRTGDGYRVAIPTGFERRP